MIRIFIGYDKKEKVAYHVLAHSILTRATCPISITPINRDNLKGIFTRERGEYDSTDFAISRFLVPYLCNYDGWAVFMDCDMLCRGDISELAGYMSLHTRWSQAIHVVKHDYIPKGDKKFLGNEQTKYKKKNWSSVMVFNNALCHALTPEYINSAPGLDLHQFNWIKDYQIGSIPKEWNYLVGEENQTDKSPKLVHFTQGGPWFHQYKDCEYADEWHHEFETMQA